jgi:hypothetical protein
MSVQASKPYVRGDSPATDRLRHGTGNYYFGLSAYVTRTPSQPLLQPRHVPPSQWHCLTSALYVQTPQPRLQSDRPTDWRLVQRRMRKVLDGPWLDARRSHRRTAVVNLRATMRRTSQPGEIGRLVGSVMHTDGYNACTEVKRVQRHIALLMTDENSFDLDSVTRATSQSWPWGEHIWQGVMYPVVRKLCNFVIMDTKIGRNMLQWTYGMYTIFVSFVGLHTANKT